jgi:hypothetical protein
MMYLRPLPTIFGVTHPLGLPRPIDPDNFFGARGEYFARNIMPVPTGCLDHFDEAVYRPHVRNIVGFLGALDFGWSGPGFISDPPRYCLMRDGIPTEVPQGIRSLIPEPPRVKLADVLDHFDVTRGGRGAVLQMLDILTMVSEDIDPAKFAAAIAGHPWVAELMR